MKKNQFAVTVSLFHYIPINLMKIVAKEIASHLTEFINSSFGNSIFPSQWKTDKKCPIPKIVIPLTSKRF